VFWAHLASANYAKDTLARLEEHQIEYIPKEENPPNVPIRDFWANLKSNIYTLQQQLSSKRCKVLMLDAKVF
jgi:hypothetical protein